MKTSQLGSSNNGYALLYNGYIAALCSAVDFDPHETYALTQLTYVLTQYRNLASPSLPNYMSRHGYVSTLQGVPIAQLGGLLAFYVNDLDQIVTPSQLHVLFGIGGAQHLREIIEYIDCSFGDDKPRIDSVLFNVPVTAREYFSVMSIVAKKYDSVEDTYSIDRLLERITEPYDE